MAEIATKTYLDQTGLSYYDEKIKEYVDNKDVSTLNSAKNYADLLGLNYDPAGTAATKVAALEEGAVKTNADAIAKLNGTDTTDGSVAKQIKDAKTELEEKITASKYDDTQVKAEIAANTAAIEAHKTVIDAKVTTLIGSDDNKSVRTIANEELAAQLIPSDAKESLDTLQEIAEWIQQHPDDASAMNIAITALQNLVGTIPTGTTSTTIVAYIKELVDAEKTRATGVEGGLDTRLTTVEELVGTGGSVESKIAAAKNEAISAAATDATTKADTALSNAKSYADGLAKNYATAAQGAKADTALQTDDIATGTANGTISVKGTNVSVKGLGSAAYESKTAFESAGAVSALEKGQVATNKTNIETLQTKVEALESETFTAITNAQIDALFATE